MEKDNRGIVYILTNPIFIENIIKIGRTEDRLEDRIKELNKLTTTPAPFVFRSAFKVDNYKKIEKILHIAYKGAGVHTDKENKRKEFFKVNHEKARELLLALAKLHNGEEVFIDENTTYSEDEKETIKKEEKNSSRKSNTKFKELKLSKGVELAFTRDNKKICIVSGTDKVSYEGKKYSLSTLTKNLLKELFGYNSHYNGFDYWEFNGEILSERRTRLEQEQERDL